MPENLIGLAVPFLLQKAGGNNEAAFYMELDQALRTLAAVAPMLDTA